MRLIDADALVQDLMGLTIVSPEVINYANVVAVAIANTPTIEAEPIVRCKDCMHRGDPEECFMCFTAVEPVEGGKMYRFHDLTTDNGYCNRGAKMDLEG